MENCVICLESISGFHFKYVFCNCRMYYHFVCLVKSCRKFGCPACRHCCNMNLWLRAICIYLLLLVTAFSFQTALLQENIPKVITMLIITALVLITNSILIFALFVYERFNVRIQEIGIPAFTTHEEAFEGRQKLAILIACLLAITLLLNLPIAVVITLGLLVLTIAFAIDVYCTFF